MRKTILKSLLAIACLLYSIGIFAHDFEVDGIYYLIITEGEEVAVTYYGEDDNNVPDEYKYTGAVVIPENVTYNDVTYSVTSIGAWAFNGCTGLTSVTIPNSVTYIGEYAFCGCIAMSYVNISNSVYYIGVCGFADCYSLKEITIPESITCIYDEAFQDCIGLEIVNFNAENCTSMGTDWFPVFGNCSNISVVNIGKNVKTIPRYAFVSCDGLSSILVDENNPIYDSRENCNAIIETATNTLVLGYKNTVIPSSVTSIGSYAFESRYLTEITIPYNITSIGERAFAWCGLTSVSLPNSVTTIGDAAFEFCFLLSEINIPNSVTSIGDYAFAACPSLIEIIIPNSVTFIGKCAFGSCASIKVEEDNLIYDSRENCNAIIETATNKLLLGCRNTNIPNSVTSIGDYAFYDCGLTEIVIPNNVTEIGEEAFAWNNNLTEVTIGNGVTTIGDYAFCDCGLTEIVIPNNVTEIGEEAFARNNNLTKVTIGNSVTTIGDYAFYDCGLTEIRVEATIPPSIQSNTFEYVDKFIPVYVPAGCIETYSNAEYWNEFIFFIENAEFTANPIEVITINSVMELDEISLPVSLINNTAIAGLQCDIYLPDGLTPVMQGDKYDIVLSSRAEGFDVTARLREDGALRIVIVNATLDAVKGNDGILFTIKLQPNELYKAGNNIVIDNIVMTGCDYTEYECSRLVIPCTIRECIMGDVNDDKNVNITDVVITTGKILDAYEGVFITAAADIDRNKVLDVTDVVGIVNLVLDEGDTLRKAPTQEDYEKGFLAMNDTEIVQGATQNVAVGLLNSAPYTAFQMDVTLPEGLVLEDVVMGDRTDSHSLQWQEQADGRVRIIGYSLSNKVIDNDGETLFSLVLHADSEPDEGEVEIDDIIFVTHDIVTHQFDKVSAKVNTVSGVADVESTIRIYAIGNRVMIESPEAQEAAISTIDGMVQRVALQAGHNEIPLLQGVYIVAVDAEVKKVVIR